MSDTQVWIILGLSVLTIFLITLFVYFARRRVLCSFPLKPRCWTDWTCIDQAPGSKKRCPVLPTQILAQSCVPEDPSAPPGCSNAWSGTNNTILLT